MAVSYINNIPLYNSAAFMALANQGVK